MFFGRGYYDDDYGWGYRRRMSPGCTFGSVVIVGLFFAGYFGWKYLDGYEGVVTSKRISHSYSRHGGRTAHYHVYYKDGKGKKQTRRVGWAAYNKANPGMIIRKKKRSWAVEVYTPAQFAKVPKEPGEKESGGTSTTSKRTNYYTPTLPGKKLRGSLPPKEPSDANEPQIEEEPPSVAATPVKPPRKVELPKLSEALPKDLPEPKKPEATAPKAEAQPRPEPRAKDMTTIYWLTLKSGREMMALKCEDLGTSYHVELPRGIKTKLAKSLVTSVREAEIETDKLDRQLGRMKEKVAEAKKREKLNRIIGGRR